MITTAAEYKSAVGRGENPLLGRDMSHEVRLEVQQEKFGTGHTPAENERFYRWCWENKPHQCEECLRPLKGYSAVYVSHILTRGAYPQIAHDPRNTNILCERCHATWENGRREDMRIYESNLARIQYLRKEYHL